MESEHKGPVMWSSNDYFDIRAWLATRPFEWIDEAGLKRLEELMASEASRLKGTRKCLVDAMNGITDVLLSLEGVTEEMQDRTVVLAMARAIWIMLDWIVHHIDREKGASE